MVTAFQIILLIMIVVTFIGMIGSDDKDVKQTLLISNIASIGVFVLSIIFRF